MNVEFVELYEVMIIYLTNNKRTTKICGQDKAT